MNGHHDLTVMTLFMFMTIEPASLLDQPFPKCCAFHGVLPPVRASCHAHTEPNGCEASPFGSRISSPPA